MLILNYLKKQNIQVTFQYESNGRHSQQYPYEFTARISYAAVGKWTNDFLGN